MDRAEGLQLASLQECSGRNFDVLHLTVWWRDHPSVGLQSFQMQHDPFANELLSFLDRRACRNTAWQVRDVVRIVRFRFCGHGLWATAFSAMKAGPYCKEVL